MLWKLFITFFKVGAFTFGSGYAMIPVIEREVIDKRKWMEKEDFRNQFTLAQSAPGPFALNTAVFVGYKLRGVWGAVVSVLGVVIPSFVILLLIAMYLHGFKDNSYVAAAFKGMRPAVIALIAVPFLRYLMDMKKWWRIVLAIVVALVIWYFSVSPIWFLFGGAVVGIISVFVSK